MFESYTAPMTNFDRIASFYQSLHRAHQYLGGFYRWCDHLKRPTQRRPPSLKSVSLLCADWVSIQRLQHFSQNFCAMGCRADRPALPTIELISRFATPREGSVNWLSQQLTVLGQPQDMAIIFASELDPADVDLIFNAINKRSMNIFWIGAAGPHGHLCFDRCDPKVSLSLYHSAAICLADLIEVAMFGPMEEYP